MEQRFLDIKAFQHYAGGIGRNKAYELAKCSGAEVRYGRRLVIDKKRFDAWVDQQFCNED